LIEFDGSFPPPCDHDYDRIGAVDEYDDDDDYDRNDEGEVCSANTRLGFLSLIENVP